MSDNGKKNENGNDSKTKPRLFEKGGPGGPGRGKRTEEDELAEAERVINKSMKSEDEKVRLKAASLSMKIPGIKQSIVQPENDVFNNPKILDAMRWYALIPQLGSVEDFWKFCRKCVDCEHFPFDREKTKDWIFLKDNVEP